MKKNKSMLFLIIIVLLVACYFLLKPSNSVFEKPEIIDEIPSYGYQLESNKTDFYADEFKHLKEILSKKEIDEKEYASSISILFVSDFYHLANKMTNQDIGGLQFLHTQMVDFPEAASDSIYKYVESNIYGDRTQELPEVKKVTVLEVTQGPFVSEIVTDQNAYHVVLNVNYKKNIGYPSRVTLVLVHEDNRLSIVKVG